MKIRYFTQTTYLCAIIVFVLQPLRDKQFFSKLLISFQHIHISHFTYNNVTRYENIL